MLKKWSCTKLIGGGGQSKNRYLERTPLVGPPPPIYHTKSLRVNPGWGYNNEVYRTDSKAAS